MKIGVLLSGCGLGDGSQIEEVMLTYVALDKYGLDYLPLAPNESQSLVMDHFTEQENPAETRNILIESARLGRGRIKALDQVRVEELSSLILPGGLGVFQNLRQDFHVLEFIRDLHDAGKPIMAMCAAVVLVAECLGTKEKRLRLGTANNAHMQTLERHFVQVQQTSAQDYVIDQKHRIISTPCFLASQNLSHIQIGIDRAVQKLQTLI